MSKQISTNSSIEVGLHNFNPENQCPIQLTKDYLLDNSSKNPLHNPHSNDSKEEFDKETQCPAISAHDHLTASLNQPSTCTITEALSDSFPTIFDSKPNSTLITEQPTLNFIVSENKILGGSTLYKVTPSVYNDNSLPKINKLTLDKKFSVSILFMPNSDLSSIYKALDEVEASYGEYNLDVNPSLKGDKVIYITSNQLEALSYLKNLYSPVSESTSLLLATLLSPIIAHTMDDSTPALMERVALYIDHWTSPDNSLDFNPGTSLEAVNMQVAIEKFRKYSDKEKEEFYEIAKINAIESLKHDSLALNSVAEVKNRAYKKKYLKVEETLNNPDKCIAYLHSKFPNSESKFAIFTTTIDSALTKQETTGGYNIYFKYIVDAVTDTIDASPALQTLKKAAGVTTSFVSLAGNAIKDIHPLLGIAVYVCKKAADVLKISYGGIDIAKIHNTAPEKKEVNHEDLIKLFACRSILCDGDHFASLDEDSIKKLGLFSGKYIYKSTTQDNNTYGSQSAYTKHLLEQLSNSSHIEKLGLNNEFNMILQDNILIKDCLASYNQSSCYNNLSHNFTGEASASTVLELYQP